MASEQSEAPPTLRTDTSVHMRGWFNEDQDEARRFATRLLALTAEYSRLLDLSRLRRIILASDYAAALAELSEPDGTPLGVATSNEFIESAAMSVVSEKDGVLESVLVISTSIVSRMFDEAESSEKRRALQTYVHELVHVDDQGFLDRTLPGGGAAAVEEDERFGLLMMMVTPAHAEYSAARRTAFIEPETGFEFLDMLEKALAKAGAEVRDDRRRYRIRQIGLETFWARVHERCRFLFQVLGYAIGHVDGIQNEAVDERLKERLRTALARIEAMDLGWVVDATRNAVLPIYEQSAWTSLAIFHPLIDVGERLLNSFGIWTRLEEGKLFIDVPLTHAADF